MQRLGEAGHRTGASRRQVVEPLAEEGCAVTALEIDRRLDSVGRASVYRTLDQLERLHLVQRVEIGGDAAGYERMDPEEHHHHLVCERCGSLVPFADAELERAIAAVGREADIDVATHDVVLRGRCPRCKGPRLGLRTEVPAVAIPLAGLTLLATLIGGQIALRLAHTLPTVIALTGGVVVAVALFDVLPEGISELNDPTRATTLVAVGFLAFFFAERGLVLHHRDDPSEARAHGRVGVLGALGLSIHSFVDGLGIGLAFGLDSTTGLLVFLAVICHDFADGLNTVSFILSQSGDRRQATRWLRIDAVAPVLGAVVGSLANVSDHTLGYILCVYSGFFLYMGATDLLPEAHAHASWARVGLTASGFAIIFAITRLAGV
jgi:ZIP family zinc transporter